MAKKNIVLKIILLVCLILPSGLIKAEVNQATVNYLTAATPNAWITQALKASGADHFNLDYLNGFEVQSANDAAKTILALVAAGQNPYSYQSQNYVGLLLNYYQNNQFGSVDLLNDDFWAILALRSAGEPADSASIIGAKNFIINAQNHDGGWAWAPASESDTNDTAAAIMALISAGQAVDSQVMRSAVSYLQAAQNNDGGFPFTNGDSDSGSDAWVIAALNKLNISPQSWQKNSHNPIEHLNSLKLNDGSFKWVASDQAGNLMMTAYAAIALAGSSFPVAVYQPIADQGIHHLRIEGQDSNICNAQVEGQTVGEVLANGAAICNYTYHIQTTAWGPYLDKINNDLAEGQNGWLYRVNWLAPEVGMADYRLNTGDEVLFYYGGWQDQPLRIFLSSAQVNPGDNLTVTAEYFNNTAWLPATNATVKVGDQDQQVDNRGQAIFSAPEQGSYLIYAQGTGLVRSAQAILLVGAGGSGSVVLEVNVNGGNNPHQPNQNQPGSIAFSVNANSLNFGSARPGSQLDRSLTITNQSGGIMYLEGAVDGDQLFKDNLLLDGKIWENYNATLTQEQSADVRVSLVVPQNYQAGHYTANLVLWASAR
ncbi:MAG: DUF4430 domain-containing protein [Candidatus Komeilibacteria bacterium]|nr:DUF4430 domain-containing protein [Candidatus Komeilibacteria bacterium]